jgi:hypothetical protein
MKNKVDFGKLIEKKYKGKALDLNDILDEIDLVIQESDQSWLTSKVIPSNLEEDPQSKQVYDRMHGAPGTRNARPPDLGYQDNVDVLPQVRPTTVAEAPQQGIQKEVQYTVKVPDLYSMMTNTKSIQPGTEDRKFINDIIKNINAPDKNWLGRVRALKEYTKFIGQPSAKQNDISEAISSLIIINVLKKVSFFTDQPGKQFEYIFAPFLHPDAGVAGQEDVEVEDINSPNGKISLKFLQTSVPGIDVSAKNLRDRLFDKNQVWKQGQKSNYPFIDYIVVRAFGNGNIQFGRVGVTNNKLFAEDLYSPVKSRSQKTLLMQIKQGDARGLSGLPGYILYMQEGGEISKQSPQGSTSALLKSPLDGKSFDLLGLKIPAEIGISNNKIDQLGKATLPAFMRSIKTNIDVKDEKNLIRLLSFLPGYKTLSPQEKDRFQIAQSVLDSYKEQFAIFKQLQDIGNKPVSESVESDKELLQEETFALSEIWQTVLVETLSLGDVDSYNQQQLVVGDSIQKMYVNVLNNLDQLNTNITKYFATAKGAKGEDQAPGEAAIKNAEEIAVSVNQIKTSKQQKNK